MPASRYMTLSDARNDVFARIGVPVDGATDPAMQAMVDSALASCQKQLVATCDWMRSQRETRFSIAAGQAWLDLPADCAPEYIEMLQWFYADDAGFHLDRGDSNIYHADDTGTPSIWDLVPAYGIVGLEVTAAGTGYTSATVAIGDPTTSRAQTATATLALTGPGGGIDSATITNAGQEYDPDNPPTVTVSGDGAGAVLTPEIEPVVAIRLAPIPEESGNIILTYPAMPAAMTADTDRLSIDPEAVIGRAAAVIAGRMRLTTADSLLAEHQDYLRNAKPKQAKPSEPVSLSVPRGRGVHVRSQYGIERGRRW